MAQVTMDSKEYIELLDKSRSWDAFNARLVEESTIELKDAHYNGYRIDIAFSIPEKAKMEIARKIVSEVVTSDKVMRKLVDEGETVLDVRSGYFTQSWGHNKPSEVDLMKFPEFKAKYEAIKAEQEEVLYGETNDGN